MCIGVSSLCDKWTHCPQHDDELLCDWQCPQNCTCYGHTVSCARRFRTADYPSLRFLEGRGSGLTPSDVVNNTLLVHLGLGACRLRQWSELGLARLHSLDLSDNELHVLHVRHFRRLIHLRRLVVAGNPLREVVVGAAEDWLPALRVLDVSRTGLKGRAVTLASGLPDLRVLNLSHCGLSSLQGLQQLAHLHVLDVRGSDVHEFPRDVLQGMQELGLVQADNAKLCCPASLPAGFNLHRCLAPADELSSCDALLRSAVYRVALTVFSVLALLGNLASFIFRLRLPSSSRRLGFHVFVMQLCVSDFLMGVYLAMIGVADRVYLGSYLWKDASWRHSAACHVAGFLSLLSSETSALTVCLITLERFIVICFPFSRVHFQGRSAYVACGLTWALGLVVAALPLTPTLAHWRFYSNTGICLPLPITRADFAGHRYSFGVMIVANLALFLLIALGQALIYWSVRLHTMAVTDTNAKVKDAVIARRLLTVVMSDFLCWFPIGLCGLLASRGFPISGEVNVAMAIFVLPVNAALNPFLYTLNVIMEKRQKQQEERIKKFLLTSMKAP